MPTEIKISLDNLYAYNSRISVLEDGTEELQRNVIEYKASDKDRLERVKISDTIDKIAYRVYKDFLPNAQRYWFLIADVNNIENPLDLSAYIGKSLIIPDPKILLGLD